MRVLRISVLITITIWSAEAISPGVIRRQHEISAHPPIVTATPTPTFHNELNYAREVKKSSTQSGTKTKSSNAASATGSKAARPKKTGLTKAATIGIGVGVPLGVIAIAGAIAAYIIGKRRGGKRRVDDPSAGAGRKIQDPSSEIMSSTHSASPLSTSAVAQPPVAELPTVRSNEFFEAPTTVERGSWWKSPFDRSASTKKERFELASTGPQSPRSPQELAA